MNIFSEYDSRYNYEYNHEDEQFVGQVLASIGFQDLDQVFKRKFIYDF